VEFEAGSQRPLLKQHAIAFGVKGHGALDFSLKVLCAGAVALISGIVSARPFEGNVFNFAQGRSASVRFHARV
jgi:hypothetical protein